jgi:hypothetical protein
MKKIVLTFVLLCGACAAFGAFHPFMPKQMILRHHAGWSVGQEYMGVVCAVCGAEGRH